MSGEYREKLPTGIGELVVNLSTWFIQYYFPGIDNRHSGTFIKVPKEEIDEFISAFKNNWLKYEKVKETSQTLGGEIRLIGEKNMTIYISSYHEGVCIQSYHMPLKSKEQIENVVADYYWAKERAKIIIEILQKLS